MKKLITLLFSLNIILCMRLPAEENSPLPLTAAVLDFQTSGQSLENRGAEVAALLNARLSSAPELYLVERQELAKLLGEQELGLSGLVSSDTAAKVGALTGAKVLVTGRLFEAGGKYYLVAKIMSTETSRVYGETTTFGDAGALGSATEELAGKIEALIGKNSSTFVAKIEDSEAQTERLRKLADGRKKLPSVSVSVTEQHLRKPVIDPAVDTEFMRALERIGFPVIDARASNQKADFVISGEAFSEYGSRRGDLVFCRGRVEIKITESSTGKLVLVDRQTETGVDISENAAGKRALEAAARQLLNRIVPALLNSSK